MSSKSIPFSEVPTEDNASEGRVVLTSDDEQVVLSDAKCWHDPDSGVFHITSLEYACFAEHEDFWQAFQAFVDNTISLFVYLGELAEEGRATEQERETIEKLSRRLLRLSLLEERRQRRQRQRRSLFGLRFHSSEQSRPGNWQPPTTPRSSSKPVPA